MRVSIPKGKVLRWMGRHPVLTAFALAAGMQLAPGLASEPASDYLNDNNYPESLAAHFNEQNIRVYDRYNPLASLHAMGRPFPAIWQNSENKTVTDKILAGAVSPVFAIIIGAQEVISYIPPYSGLDAYAIPYGKTCYIRPPIETDLKQFLAKMSGIGKIDDADKIKIKNDPEQVVDALRTYIMAHEMRHCEQPRSWDADNIKESDSDLKAFDVLKDSGYNPAVIEETSKIVTAVRMIASLDSDKAHDTGLNVEKKDISLINAYLTDGAYQIIGGVTDDIIKNAVFPDEMKGHEKTYHAIRAMSRTGLLNGNRSAQSYTESYAKAFEYLNELSGGILIASPDYYQELDLSYLGINNYKPAPDQVLGF